MSANLIDKRHVSAPKRLHISHTDIDRRKRRKPIQHYSLPPVTDNEEMSFVARCVLWMLVLAVTPWILFYIIILFNPELFRIQITPN